MVRFLSINFFSWISSIFVGFFKSYRFLFHSVLYYIILYYIILSYLILSYLILSYLYLRPFDLRPYNPTLLPFYHLSLQYPTCNSLGTHRSMYIVPVTIHYHIVSTFCYYCKHSGIPKMYTAANMVQD